MFRTHVKLYLPSLCKRKPRFPLNKSNWLREIYVKATFAKICVGVVKCFSNFTKSHQLHQNIFWQFKARMALRKRLIAELNVAPKIGPFFNSKLTSSPEWCNKRFFLCFSQRLSSYCEAKRCSLKWVSFGQYSSTANWFQAQSDPIDSLFVSCVPCVFGPVLFQVKKYGWFISCDIFRGPSQGNPKGITPI